MEDPALYHRANIGQRRDVKQLLEEYSHLLRWRSDGQDSLLDVGCGVGDVTVDFVLPLLPVNFSRLVGVDISEEMLQYARENFQRSKVVYHKLDIGEPIDQFDETFDHITSFYCLHWVKNQDQAMKNIYNLLMTEGDCLFLIMAGNPWFEIYEPMSLTFKWQPYMQDLQMHKFQYHAESAADDLKNVLKNAGFRQFQVTLHHKQFVFDGKEQLKNCLGSVTLFLARMSPAVKDEYIDYIASRMPRLDGKLLITYRVLIAYARK